MDFLNRRAFENFNASTRKELNGQIVKFLDGITGPNKLIENFTIKTALNKIQFKKIAFTSTFI